MIFKCSKLEKKKEKNKRGLLGIEFFGLLTSTQNIDTDKNGTDRDGRKRGMFLYFFPD